jgi:hypothetical protein
VYSTTRTGGGINCNGYSNPKVGMLVAEAGTQTDRTTRDDLYL